MEEDVKILIINPNSDEEMTQAIQKGADGYTRGDFDAVCVSTPGGPKYIETYEDMALAAPGMMELVRRHEKEYDAFIIACHCDPNIELLKEITKKPVVGIGESSMKLASMLGHRFSVVSIGTHSIPNKEAVIRKYHLEGYLASVRASDDSGCGYNEAAMLTEIARKAVDEDMAEVIVLGCAGMAGLDKDMQDELGVPVIDGVVSALMIAGGLVRHGLSTSKVRRYSPEY